MQVQPQPLQHRQRGLQREQRRAPGRKRPTAAAGAGGFCTSLLGSNLAPTETVA